MHAAQRSAWHAVRAAICRSVTMSASASRPPGRSTRAASANTLRLSAREIDHAVGDHGVERAVVEGQLLDPRAVEAHVLVAAQALGLGELLGRDVDAGDEPAGPTCAAAANTSMPEPLPRSSTRSPGQQAREAEVVAHARERVHGFGGQPVEQIGGVAERLGERTAGREVEVAARLVRHVAVHLRDVAVELLGIHAPGGAVCGVHVHAGSVAGTPSLNLPLEAASCGEVAPSWRVVGRGRWCARRWLGAERLCWQRPGVVAASAAGLA